MDGSGVLALVALLWVLMGGLVGSIAVMKGKDPFVWFLYGFMIWPVALIHVLMTSDAPAVQQAAALRSGVERKCPFCAEMIKAEAIVCKHCGRDVEPAPQA